jgi:hypothetical protein
MTYDHTQRIPVAYRWLGYTSLFVFFAPVVVILFSPAPAWCWATMTVVMFVMALSLQYLRVYDGGDSLHIHYGPLRLFGTSIRYDEIRAVERGRFGGFSYLVWGYGPKWLPFRGWTYRIWGYNCVVVRCAEKTIRIGTDDADNLLAFLQTKLKPRMLEIG